MSERAASLAPLVTLIAAVALITRSPPLVIVAASLLALATVVGGRLRPGPGAQRATLIAVATAGFFVSASLAPEAPYVRDRLSGPWCGLAMAAALPCFARALFARPEGGVGFTFALGALSLCFLGQARVTPWYIAVCALYVGATIVAFRTADRERPRYRTIPLRHWGLGAVVVLTTVGSVGLAARSLPPLHARAIERFMRAVRGANTTGFDEQFALGSIESMSSSDEVVARVYGPAPEMLRGIAYNQYLQGRWTSRRGGGRTRRTLRGRMAGAGVTHVEVLSASSPVFFLPLVAGPVATLEGTIHLDALGALWRLPRDTSLNLWYRPGTRGELSPSPPDADDTAVPRRLTRWLRPLALAWTANARTDAERVEAIVRALRQGYRYRLAVRRAAHTDPVADFLFTHRAGNCEYFATSTALLARSIGIPARAVGGYRVGEFNALGGFHIVRERNAHAWIEVWDGSGAWVTVDPTPERAIPANQPHRSPLLRALLDASLAWITALRRIIAALTATQLLVGAAALLVLWQLWRLWSARRATRDDARVFTADERPHPALVRLDEQLARRGLQRHAGETLDRHARRIEERESIDAALRAELARALRAYAAARYGHSDEAAAAALVDAARARLQRSL